MMKNAVCFTLMLLQGALCASLPVNKPTQNFDSFMRFLLAEAKTTFEDAEDVSDRLENTEIAKSDSTEISPVNEIVKHGCHVPQIAFHAYLSSSQCYSNAQLVKFDNAPVDIGSYHGRGFNTHTGIFFAPATGLYAFTWTMAAEHGTWFTSQLVVDGDVKGQVMSDADVGGRASGIHPATGFVLTHVGIGKVVFIRYVSGHGCKVKSDRYTRSTFSGWLMYN